ncbi:acetate/propionate family kinase [Paeniglutamicibacter sp. ZC-3]|uniref:acetate/propionate family kinase n=1 Tax=Paeniglutamicibacter sp. ZC-3 TaxID=2986919 RepID=UPI0021F788CF|nr:acetate/propionate family kinase [Paeniglutamicibacter sp. ZC-3]MCV9995592.1 acetate/propionate family kinase [Paeniglutamicibacter sp. ZC-3]
MLILALMCGPESIRYQLRHCEHADAQDASVLLASGEVPKSGGRPEISGSGDGNQALAHIKNQVQEFLGERTIDAIGHRVVHGGEKFTEPVALTEETIAALEDLTRLAPRHNPDGLQGIRGAGALWPGIPQVAVFDTAFHQTMPETAWRYAIPGGYYSRHGIRRYGFHGISVGQVTRAASHFLGLGVGQFDGIIAHLGDGSSVTAIKGGRSIDTSMGYSPADGLIGGTRCGDIDPSVLLYLQRKGLDPEGAEEMLDRHCGFQALCGLDDLAFMEKVAANGGKEAGLALEMAAYRLAKYAGGYHVAVGGAKALVFTGSIGESAAGFRSLVVGKLAALGLALDEAANRAPVREPRCISTAGSVFPVLVVPTDEERAIAEATAALLSRTGTGRMAQRPDPVPAGPGALATPPPRHGR